MGILREQKLSGPASFWLTLLLLTPSLISFLASAVLSRAQDYPSSALWFVYNDSLYIGYAGVVIAGIFTVAKGIQGHISRIFVVMMGVSVILAIVLLWYAQHLYRNPWYAVE
jgi:SNF family Na+-dependent transporter